MLFSSAAGKPSRSFLFPSPTVFSSLCLHPSLSLPGTALTWIRKHVLTGQRQGFISLSFKHTHTHAVFRTVRGCAIKSN